MDDEPLTPKNTVLRRFFAVEMATASVLLGIVLSIGGGIAFALVMQGLAHNANLLVFDTELSVAFHAQATPFSTGLYRVVTWFGGLGLWFVIALAAGLFFVRRRWTSLTIWLIGTCGGGALNTLLKAIFQRPRPVFDLPIMVETGFSFPSGHAMTSLIVYGLLLYLLWRELHSRAARILLAFVLTLLVVFIGISRMALGVHYVSDVVGGYAAGAVWLGLCMIALHGLERRTLAVRRRGAA